MITREEIDKLPATDISTALESVAGVHVARTTGAEPRIIIRGLQNQNSANGNYTLFLINGRRISSSETVIRGASFDLSSIPMSAIERIEVVRGPMSSLYGSEAIGGVVNVILKHASTETHVSGSLTIVCQKIIKRMRYCLMQMANSKVAMCSSAGRSFPMF